MRLHSWVEDPPRMVFVLRDVRDTLHFLVPCGVKAGIELARILGCREFRHCSQVKRNKKRGEIFWAEEKLRGGGNFQQTCFYKPKTFFLPHKSKFCKNKPHFSDRVYNKKGHKLNLTCYKQRKHAHSFANKNPTNSKTFCLLWNNFALCPFKKPDARPTLHPNRRTSNPPNSGNSGF